MWSQPQCAHPYCRPIVPIPRARVRAGADETAPRLRDPQRPSGSAEEKPGPLKALPHLVPFPPLPHCTPATLASGLRAAPQASHHLHPLRLLLPEKPLLRTLARRLFKRPLYRKHALLSLSPASLPSVYLLCHRLWVSPVSFAAASIVPELCLIIIESTAVILYYVY